MQLFAALCGLVGIHLHTYIVLHWYFSLGKTSGPTTKAADSEVLLKVVLMKVRSWCSSYENQVGDEQILYEGDQNSLTIKLLYFIFSKHSSETFRCSKDKFRGHLNLLGRVKTVCFQMHNGVNRM